MEVSLTPDVEAKLKGIASHAGKGADQIVRELVVNYLDHDEWFRQEVGKGLASLGQGKSVHTKKCAAKWSEFSAHNKIRWSPEAAADFAGIVEYIHKENPSASDRGAHAIYDSATLLESLPNRGRVRN